MALRTNSPDVIAMLGANYDSTSATDVTPFMTTANVIVNNLVTCAATKGKTLTDETLEQMELLLACHFYQLQDPGYKSKQTGKASGSFHGESGTGYDFTPYGSQAKAMDLSGCLGVREVGIAWLGKPDSSKIDYDQRN